MTGPRHVRKRFLGRGVAALVVVVGGFAAAPGLAASPRASTVPPPVLGRAVDVAPVSGLVYVKPPPGRTVQPATDRVLGEAAATGPGFVQLTHAEQVPAGSQIDARAGRLRLTAAPASTYGRLQTGTFTGAIFGVAQDSRGVNKGLTTLSMIEGAFSGAPSYASCKAGKAPDGSPSASAASSKVLQALLATAKGKFRTKGHFSAATVRGTAWGERDRCDGSLTVVRRGSVTVRDFVRHVTVVVRAGHTYLARAQ